MGADEQTKPGQQWPRELTPEEARALRARHLARAREMALSGGEQDRADSEATDATTAAFVLPGGD